MKNILIVETYYEGHYLTGYIKYILRSLKNKKFFITLLTSNKSLKYGRGALEILKKEKVNFKILTTNFDTKTSFYENNLYFTQIINYFKIKKFLKKNSNLKFDFVCFSSLQRFLIPFSLYGNPFKDTPIIGVFLGAKFHLKHFGINQEGRYDFVFKFLFRLFIRKSFIRHVIVNDHLLKKYFNRTNNFYSQKITFLHDPKETRFKFNKSKIRKSFNYSPKYKYLLLYGALIQSKGIEQLFHIIRSKNINKNLRLIIAGKQFLETKKFLKSSFAKKIIKQKKIQIFNDWQTEKMEAKLLSLCDIVWIAYKNYSTPSGVLYQAASLGLPVVVSNDGLIHKLNKKYNFGISVDINKSNLAANKINNFFHDVKYRKYSKNIRTFYKTSEPDNWVKGFLNIIDKL
tara:strand:+ start:4596 stop:5795 length:1200 start_codon:yes stop_codon:yes gene_type:complete